MHYTITTPPASRAAERPNPIDDALIAEARGTLSAAVESLPLTTSLTRRTSQELFRAPMAALCGATRPRGVPIEKLIVAIKLAWGSLAGVRVRFGDTARTPSREPSLPASSRTSRTGSPSEPIEADCRVTFPGAAASGTTRPCRSPSRSFPTARRRASET